VQRLLWTLSWLLVSAVANATTVVIDGGTGNLTSRYFADENTTFPVASTEVVLNNPVQFSQFDWWGGYSLGTGNGPSNFQLLIYSAANNSPIVPIAVESLGNGNQTATGKLFAAGEPEYAYSGTFSTLSLAAGQYFFGIDQGGSVTWGWEQTNGGQQLGGGSFDQFGQFHASSTENLAFQALDGAVTAVPEPSTYFVMLVGLVMCFTVARFRRSPIEPSMS
jgi:hypothetical protein